MRTKRFRRLAPLLLAVPAFFLLGRAPAAETASEAWRSVPPDGGAISGLGASAGSPAAVWATTPYSGVFRSLDNGTTWSRTRTPTLPARLVGVDPQNGDRVFVTFFDPQTGTLQLGLFFTTNGGATWSRASRRGFGNDYNYIYQVAFDPHDPDVVYAGAWRGLYRSVDGGRSWSLLWQGERYWAVPVVTVAPDDPRLLLVSTSDRVYRSTDGGATFTEVWHSDMSRGIVFDPHDPNRVYGTTGALFRSTDRGLTWERIGRNFELSAESVAVGEDGKLYAGTRFGVIHSFDGGTTFTPATTPDVGHRHPDDNIVAIAPLANGDVLAAGDRGIWRRLDGEHGWRAASEGIRGLDISGLAITAGGRLLASVPDNGVFHSDDGGVRFRSSTRGLRNPDGRTPGLLFIPSPSSPQVVYGDYDGWISRSDDAGVSWRLLNQEDYQRAPLLAVHPTNPDVLYAGGDDFDPHEPPGKCHALRSGDGGATWSCLEGPDLSTLTSLVIDPQRPSRLFGLDDYDLFRISDDEGTTWREAGRGLPKVEFISYALVMDARGRLFVGTEDGRVFRSLDGGESFAKVSRNLPREPIETLIADPLRPDTLYAFVYGQGVFRSQDGGRRWERLDAGLPAAWFTGAVTLDAERRLLFAGIKGRGLFVLDVR